ncbi:MAG: hypothetical protein IK130_06285 [Oscillospiraceae bacterium]|nr:hypothetical protein [Oscillospiraceae bacterium]
MRFKAAACTAFALLLTGCSTAEPAVQTLQSSIAAAGYGNSKMRLIRFSEDVQKITLPES